MPYPFQCISDFVFVDHSPQPAQVILIPGGSHPQLMQKAAQLYHEKMAPLLLPSGHFNPRIPEYASEWEFLKEIGVRLGVPGEAILREDQASHTFENARFSLEVLQKRGLVVEKAILVCKAYHSRRALLTYQAVFPKEVTFFVVSVTDQNGIQKLNWFQKEHSVNLVMGEVVKIGRYFPKQITQWYQKLKN